MRITGTFLFNSEWDIPSNNWGEKEWARDFRIMRAVGIDTVILICSGWQDMSTYPSEVLKKHAHALPVNEDLAGMFLRLAEKEKMSFYMGTYLGTMWGYTPENCGEVKEKDRFLNFKVIEELWKMYGKSPAFKGWYNSFELNTVWRCCTDLVRDIGLHCKEVSGGLPVLLSPYHIPYTHYKEKGMKAPKGITNEKDNLEKYFVEQWEEMFSELEGSVDNVAFMYSGIPFSEVPEYFRITARLIKKHGMRVWSNTETFSDTTRVSWFPPIDWRLLRWKLEMSRDNGDIEKAITFEFSHYLSPYSLYPSARNLFYRYCEYHNIPADKVIEAAQIM